MLLWLLLLSLLLLLFFLRLWWLFWLCVTPSRSPLFHGKKLPFSLLPKGLDVAWLRNCNSGWCSCRWSSLETKQTSGTLGGTTAPRTIYCTLKRLPKLLVPILGFGSKHWRRLKFHHPPVRVSNQSWQLKYFNGKGNVKNAGLVPKRAQKITRRASATGLWVHKSQTSMFPMIPHLWSSKQTTLTLLSKVLKTGFPLQTSPFCKVHSWPVLTPTSTTKLGDVLSLKAWKRKVITVFEMFETPPPKKEENPQISLEKQTKQTLNPRWFPRIEMSSGIMLFNHSFKSRTTPG